LRPQNALRPQRDATTRGSFRRANWLQNLRAQSRRGVTRTSAQAPAASAAAPTPARPVGRRRAAGTGRTAAGDAGGNRGARKNGTRTGSQRLIVQDGSCRQKEAAVRRPKCRRRKCPRKGIYFRSNLRATFQATCGTCGGYSASRPNPSSCSCPDRQRAVHRLRHHRLEEPAGLKGPIG
jgi:hypothetical protein